MLRLLVRSGLRRHWGETLFVAVLCALTIAVCASALAVSRLTLTAFPRTLDAVNAPDLTVHLGGDDPVPAEELAALPGIAHMTLILVTDSSEVDTEGQAIFYERTGLVIALDGDPAVPILQGRMPSADAPDEVAISNFASEIFGANVGDHFRYLVATGAEPDGAIVDLIVVGVFGPVAINGPVDAPTSNSRLVVGRAFLDKHPGAGVYPQAGVTLRDDTTMASFLRTLQQRFGGRVDPETRADTEAQARQAVEPEAYAVLGFGLLTGLIGLVITGLSIGRLTLGGADDSTMLALGLNRRQRATQRWVRSMFIIAIGAVLGGVAALFAINKIGAIGIADAFDRADVRTGDLMLAVNTGMIVVALLAVIAAASAWRNSRVLRQPQPATPPPAWFVSLVSATPTDVRTAAALAGRGTGAHRATRAALVGIATSVAITVSVITFAGSLDALVSTPSLYGSDYDLAAWDVYNRIPDDVISTALASDADIIEVARSAPASGTVGGHAAEMTGFDSFAVGAVVTSGVYPSAIDEVLLGRRLARRLNVAVGDEVVVEVGDVHQTYQVVGLGVMPEITGDGAAFTLDGLRRVANSAEVGSQYVRVRPGVNVDDVIQHFGEACPICEIFRPAPPSDLAYLNRGSEVPRWSVGFVVLLGTAISINALLIVGRRSRRSVAVLRAIGATRHQVTRYLLSQALLIVLSAILLGVALGAIVGPFVWSRFADALGIVPSSTTDLAAVGLSIAILIVVTTAVAAVPARRAANRQVAPELHAD